MSVETLEKLARMYERKIEKCTDQLEQEGSKIPEQDARYIDYLTHTLKSLETIKAMKGYGSSERRGRDSMGRYTSREGEGSSHRYAYDRGTSYADEGGRSMHGDNVREELRRMMDEADDERVRRALHEAMRQV